VNTTAIDVTNMPPLTHGEAMALQATELDRTLELLRSLSPADWSAQTDCPDWDVRRMYLHVLGACEAGASMREMVHQMRVGKRYQKLHGGPLEAGLSATQVAERLEYGPDELIARLEAVAPVTVRKRTKMPSLMRKAKMKIDGPVFETWALGYLVDTIYLRDAWMHRVDASRATGRELHLSADHDGHLVADVVAEWARRHGQPFTLRLTGPAGGIFTSSGTASRAGDAAADSPEELELDAVDFCRTLCGRAEGDGLLATIVPF
jgi:uncharacterized protein (TIGR03083 family)